MEDDVLFSNFVTKGLEIEKSDDRIFTGHVTAEVVDRQNEFVFVKEVMDIMETYMAVNPVMSETHSNRIVAKVLKYEQSEIEGHPSVKITGQVYKQKGVTLYDKVWEKVQKRIYKGLSMGGASKTREPILKDDKLVMSLKDLELYEIALCVEPANPLAIIDYVNDFAKSDDMIKNIDGRQIIQCNSLHCSFKKSTEPLNKANDIDALGAGRGEGTGTNADSDSDMDNVQPKKLPINKYDSLIKELELFTKPIRGHSFSYWNNKLRGDYPDEKTRARIIGAMEHKKGEIIESLIKILNK